MDENQKDFLKFEAALEKVIKEKKNISKGQTINILCGNLAKLCYDDINSLITVLEWLIAAISHERFIKECTYTKQENKGDQ